MSDLVQKKMKDSDYSHPSFSDEQNGYVRLLINALQRFYENDARDLFEGKDDLIGECAMVGCISRYVWCGRNCGKFDYLLPDVDIEYNKDHEPDSKVVEKNLVAPPECWDGPLHKQCEGFEMCWKEIDEYKKDRCKRHQKCKGSDCEKPPYKFRPDLIIPRRGPSLVENIGVIIEFKKCEVSKCEKTEEIAFDLAKIRYCTCEDAHYKYKVGVFVLLKKTQADVFIFAKHKFAGAFSVTAKGRAEVDVTQSEYEPLKKLAEDPSQETTNK